MRPWWNLRTRLEQASGPMLAMMGCVDLRWPGCQECQERLKSYRQMRGSLWATRLRSDGDLSSCGGPCHLQLLDEETIVIRLGTYHHSRAVGVLDACHSRGIPWSY